MKKKICLFLLVLVSFPIFAAAKNCFVDGMKWETLLTSMVAPYPTYSLVYDVIDGEETLAGYTAMKLYEYRYGEDSRTFKLYLRVDGDKVYFLNPDIDAEKWFRDICCAGRWTLHTQVG